MREGKIMGSTFRCSGRIVAFLLIFFALIERGTTARGEVRLGVEAPPFTLESLEGARQSVSSLSAGKRLTVVVFWAFWSDRSRRELKRLQGTFDRYGTEGLQVIAVNVEGQSISKEAAQKIAAFRRDAGLSFPILVDKNLETFYRYSVIAIPTTLVLDEKRTIVYRLAGYPIAGSEQLFSTIKNVMEGKKELKLEEAKCKLPDSKTLRYFRMGKLLYEKGDLSGAADALNTAINMDPEFVDPYNLLGRILHEGGRDDDAIGLFERALSKNPEDCPLQADYGNLLVEIGRLEKGIAIIQNVLKKDPSYSPAHYYLASSLLSQGKRAEALKHIQVAIELNPLDFNAHRFLGNLYESEGKKVEALAAYKRAANLLEKKVKAKNVYYSLTF
jgi:tetratricopeptide (TPR) repeat protein